MKKIFSLLTLVLVGMLFASCEYRDHADAEYPECMVYQPCAGSIMNIDAQTNPLIYNVPTSSEPQLFVVDKAQGKLIINLGVVQSGITLASGSVTLAPGVDVINTMITDGSLDNDIVILPISSYDMPHSLDVVGANTPYRLSVTLDAIKANPGKKVALAVTIMSDNFAVNEKLATQVILIDADYLSNI